MVLLRNDLLVVTALIKTIVLTRLPLARKRPFLACNSLDMVELKESCQIFWLNQVLRFLFLLLVLLLKLNLGQCSFCQVQWRWLLLAKLRRLSFCLICQIVRFLGRLNRYQGLSSFVLIVAATAIPVSITKRNRCTAIGLVSKL